MTFTDNQIDELIVDLKRYAGDYRIAMEGPPRSHELSWTQQEVRTYEAAAALVQVKAERDEARLGRNRARQQRNEK